MELHEVIATGIVADNIGGINMMNSNKYLKWVAVRGDIHDWAIYCHWADSSYEYVKSNGDKVHDEQTIKKLVPCSKLAFKMYRY